jgi:putative PIN family toxin of toxin-antitoxin system
LDTNVIISATLRPGSVPHQVVAAVFSRRIQIVVCDSILLEYRKVMTRPRFGFDADVVDGTLDLLEAIGVHAIPQDQGADFSAEPTDAKFYNLAKAAGAILVTGNMRHFPDDEQVMAPANFLRLLS